MKKYNDRLESENNGFPEMSVELCNENFGMVLFIADSEHGGGWDHRCPTL